MCALIGGLLALVLGSCESEPGPDPQGTSQAPVIRVGTEGAFPPFNAIGPDGEPVGFEIDLVREASARAGFDPRFIVEPVFADLFTEIDGGRLDVLASTVGITPEREQRYLLTRPYFKTGLVVLVMDEQQAIQTPADLSGRAVGAPAATTSAATAGTLGAEVREFGTSAPALEALVAGEIDAYVIDAVEGRALADADKRVRVLPDLAAEESYALLVTRDASVVHELLDRALAGMSEDGTIDRLRALHGLPE